MAAVLDLAISAKPRTKGCIHDKTRLCRVESLDICILRKVVFLHWKGMGSQQEMHLDPQYPCSVVKQVPSSDSSQGFLL